MPNRLKELRRSIGVTQKELAAALRIAQPTLSGWETGRFQIDYDNLLKLADYFNTSIDYILGRDTNENSEYVSDSYINVTDKPAVRGDHEKLLGVYDSLDDQSKTTLMSVAYMLMAKSLENQGINIQQVVEQQLHKIQNKGSENHAD